MTEIWQAIGILVLFFVVIFVIIGIVQSGWIFFNKVWEHINQVHKSEFSFISMGDNPITVSFSNESGKDICIREFDFTEPNKIKCRHCGEVLVESTGNK